MRKTIMFVIVLFGLSACATTDTTADVINVAAAQPDQAARGWPRMFENQGNRVVLYQPQLDNWESHTNLSARAAVAVNLKGRDKEIYGALYIEADTETNFDSRMVLLKKFRVTQFNFPNLDQGLAKKARAAIIKALPKKSMLISQQALA